jgi:rRNA maturation RNase YbeY
VLCNDLYLLKINQNFLNHDSLTDIITFQYNEIDKGLSGELYISMERVKENARNYGVKTKNELARVMVHGFYHLCGYKDKIRKEKELMRAKENSALEFLHESFNL